MLVKVPVGVGADAERTFIGPAGLPPQTVVLPRVDEAIGVGDQKEIPVIGVQKGLVVGQVLGQFIDGVEQGGGSNPFAGVQNGVEEDAVLAGAVGDLDDSEGTTLEGGANVDDGHQLGEGGSDFVNVGLNLEILCVIF